MRTYRCYHPDIIQPDQDLLLTHDASHHLGTVLRAKVGNPIEVFDVSGQAYAGTLLSVTKKVSVRLERRLTEVVESPLHIHLAQAIGKNDKIDWVIQKAVELGVSELSLLLTERTEVRVPPDQWQKKMLHWQRVLVSALEQSGRTTMPRLHFPVSLPQFLQQPVQTDLAIMLHVEGAKRLREVAPTHFTASRVLIGPEGGFSDSEVALALSHGYEAISVGPRVMRTETAPLAIISLLQWLQGDF